MLPLVGDWNAGVNMFSLRVCSKISAGKNPLEYSGWIRPILATKTASGISAGWNS
jgi:S-adenosylmethionine synthetase